MSVTYIVTLSLLIFPSLGLLLGYLTKEHPIVRGLIVYPILLIGVIAILGALFGFSTIYTSLDLILYSSLYLSISLLLWYIFFKKSRILAAALMLVIYTFGYIFSLVLPLTSDLVPKSEIRFAEDYIYKETESIANFSGKRVEIYKIHASIFEKRIFSKDYKDCAPAFVNEVLDSRYDEKSKLLILYIPTDKSKYMYTFHENFDLNWKDTIYLADY